LFAYGKINQMVIPNNIIDVPEMPVWNVTNIIYFLLLGMNIYI
jgi:hypothetical protein